MADQTASPGAGQQDPSDAVGGFNPFDFAVVQRLARISTIKVVKVLAVDASAHTVDVQIAVNQLDGQDNSSPHGTINGVPYMWAMGGTNAFQIDPAVGDLGLIGVCDRDISAVKAAKAIANPGSNRKFSPSDGIYLFGIPGINGTAPTQWFKWPSGGGFNVTDSFGNVLQGTSAGIVINGLTINRQGQVAGNLPVTGNLQISGTITALLGTTWGGNILTTGSIQGASVSNGVVDLSTHHHIAPAGGGATGGALP